jgi:SAM-dependent methyltransferase
VELSEAIALLRPAVPAGPGTWADLGAGRGLFSRALAAILGEAGRVVAVERDPRALRDLERVAAAGGRPAPIEVAAGDFLDLPGIPALRGLGLDGALYANALHYVAAPEAALRALGDRLVPGGRVVVIEYDRERANRWVPYPIPVARLGDVAERAGLHPPEVVGRRPSAYQGEMYCAVMRAPERPPRPPPA